MRYCYIVQSLEIPIVRVYSGYIEACIEAEAFAKDQGATKTVIKKINDSFTEIAIIETETPMKVWVERWVIS